MNRLWLTSWMEQISRELQRLELWRREFVSRRFARPNVAVSPAQVRRELRARPSVLERRNRKDRILKVGERAA